MFVVAGGFFVVLLFLVPHGGFALLAACSVAAAAIGALETGALLAASGRPAAPSVAAVCGAALPAAAYVDNMVPELAERSGGLLLVAVAGLLVAVVVSGALAAATGRRPLQSLAGRSAATAYAAVYPALGIAFVVKLASFPEAQWVFLLFFVAVFANDTAAYVFGSLARGRTRLGMPVSPNKTLIGYLAGLAASIAAVLALRSLLAPPASFSPSAGLLAGAALGVVAPAGDLFASALKRSAGVKDSGTLIPGRGGLLDSIDSLLPTAPLFYYFLILTTSS